MTLLPLKALGFLALLLASLLSGGTVSANSGWFLPNDLAEPQRLPEAVPEESPEAQEIPRAEGALVIVIDDLGPSQPATRRALELPSEITLSFLPYGHRLRHWTAQALSEGHEILLHLPMESDAGLHPTDQMLLTGLSAEELRARLGWSLGQFDGFIGINNHMGSRFAKDQDALGVIMREIAKEPLFFLDSVTTASSQIEDMAQAHGVPSLRRDLFLDHRPGYNAVYAQLRNLEKRAAQQGFAIGIGHPHEETLRAIEDWLASERLAGVTLVPISELLHQPSRVDSSRADNSRQALSSSED